MHDEPLDKMGYVSHFGTKSHHHVFADFTRFVNWLNQFHPHFGRWNQIFGLFYPHDVCFILLLCDCGCISQEIPKNIWDVGFGSQKNPKNILCFWDMLSLVDHIPLYVASPRLGQRSHSQVGLFRVPRHDFWMGVFHQKSHKSVYREL